MSEYNCPICRSEAKRFPVEGRKCAKCKKCDHVFVTDYSINYSDRGIAAWKNNCEFQNIHNIDDGPEWNEFVAKRIKSLQDHCIKIYDGTTRTFIEIGCMEGQVLKRMSDIGHTVIGYEPTKDIAMLRNFIRPIGIEGDSTIEEIADAIFSFHVFEHLFDPVKTTEKIFQALKPGGKIFIETPISDEDYWNPDHIHFFTIQSLSILLSKFSDIKITIDGFININKVECQQIQISGRK